MCRASQSRKLRRGEGEDAQTRNAAEREPGGAIERDYRSFRLRQSSCARRPPFCAGNNRSFMILSLGLFADDSSQSRTFLMLTVWVTLGLRASTSIVVAEPGAQSCSRNARNASATAS
jgi:hypothetical protein